MIYIFCVCSLFIYLFFVCGNQKLRMRILSNGSDPIMKVVIRGQYGSSTVVALMMAVSSMRSAK